MEQIEKIQGTEKEFIKVFQELCYSRSSWQVWADLMAAADQGHGSAAYGFGTADYAYGLICDG